MGRDKINLSRFKGMWLLAMFDLPVTSKNERRKYTQFRKSLIKDGFTMLQFSVYARYCESEEASSVHRKRIRNVLPERGHVRLLYVTDHQFGKMEVFLGKKSRLSEKTPSQLMLL